MISFTPNPSEKKKKEEKKKKKESGKKENKEKPVVLGNEFYALMALELKQQPFRYT